ITIPASGSQKAVTFAYGRAGDEFIAGDWDGDGKDTVAVRRGNQFFVNNHLAGGEAQRVFVYGRATDRALAGDWNGDGKDTFAVQRGNMLHLR
ncbi:hypothetical protein NPS74_21140, partial [Cutibacterium acnes subsp. acnes]|nr:hypothetical protein [Cutibacterium acnes subsp. acnes]